MSSTSISKIVETISQNPRCVIRIEGDEWEIYRFEDWDNRYKERLVPVLESDPSKYSYEDLLLALAEMSRVEVTVTFP